MTEPVKLPADNRMKYIILRARLYDENNEILDERMLPVIFPAVVRGNHGVGSLTKQLIYAEYRIKRLHGGFFSILSGRFSVHGKLTEDDDGVDLEPGPEDIAILQDTLSED